MYTIKQAAARTNLTVATLRAWERRYGVVQPTRTAARYRLYDESSLARLAAMRQLVVAEGWRPSQAAQHVLAADVDLGSILGRAHAVEQGPGSDLRTPESTSPATASVAAFLDAARRLDVPGIDRILDETFAGQRFELALEAVVFPALHAVGTAWAAGEIDVGAEHAASETVRRRLAHFYDASTHGGRAPLAIVGLPPTGRHEIGAFAFAVAARRVGISVLYLGADVPLSSWVDTVQTATAPIVVLGVIVGSDVAAAELVIGSLHRSAAPPVCVVGGPLAGELPEALGAIRLPERLDDAVAVLRELLVAVEAPRR